MFATCIKRNSCFGAYNLAWYLKALYIICTLQKSPVSTCTLTGDISLPVYKISLLIFLLLYGCDMYIYDWICHYKSISDFDIVVYKFCFWQHVVHFEAYTDPCSMPIASRWWWQYTCTCTKAICTACIFFVVSHSC